MLAEADPSFDSPLFVPRPPLAVEHDAPVPDEADDGADDDLPADIREQIRIIAEEAVLGPGALVKGSLHQGTVLHVEPRHARMLVDGKDAVLSAQDYFSSYVPDMRQLVKPGDVLEVCVVARPRLYRPVRVGAPSAAAPARPRDEIGARTSALVVEVAPHGAIVVKPDGEQMYLPRREIAWVLPRGMPADELVRRGMNLKVMVLETARGGGLGVVSQRLMLPDPWPDILQRYPPGKRVRGTVLETHPGGIAVELMPGVHGLLRAGDMSWVQPLAPVEWRYGVGEPVTTTVVGHVRRRRAAPIVLGVKQMIRDPWLLMSRAFQEGRLVPARVHLVTPAGVVLAPQLAARGTATGI